MAIAQQTINVSEQAVDNVNILLRWPFEAVPITLDFTGETLTVIPAGAPIDATGKLVDGTLAVGILLHDVSKDYPVGSVVVEGFINTTIAEAHVSAVLGETFTYEDDVKAALPNVHFGLEGYAPAE